MKRRLRLDAWEDYAEGTRGEHFAQWAAHNLVLGRDRFAGQPLVLEPEWQAPIMYEALAVEAGAYGGWVPYWKTVIIVLTRKNAKTMTLAAYADYELDTGVGEPEILLAAGSDKQAGRLFLGCAGFIRRSPELSSRLHVREYNGEISRVDGAGKINRLSSEGDTQHGADPSLIVVDELHVWRSLKLRRSWGALTTAGGARSQGQLFGLTTEGEASGRSDSILGQLVDGNELVGDVDRHAGLTVSRDHASRTIVFRFHAVDAVAADPRPLRQAHAQLKEHPTPKLEREARRLEKALLASVMPANPASWITPEYILHEALANTVMPSDFLQLHANVAVDSRGQWIPTETWAALNDHLELPVDGDPELSIVCAVDAGLSHDSTAVVWAWAPEGDDRVHLGLHTWCAAREGAYHEFVPGGRIRNDAVKDFLRHLAGRYHLAACTYDPKFFEDAAMELSDEGLMMVPLAQQGGHMRQAEQQFHDAVFEGTIAHSGDRVLAAHVAATIAERVGDGWRIRKVTQSALIDGLVASCMAHYHYRKVIRMGGHPLVEVLA